MRIRMRRQVDYDVVIIGTGVGGLTTGAFLARQGIQVLLCEQHSQPGGYFTSFTRGGYTFDGGIQGCEDGGLFFNLLRHLGILDSIEFHKAHFALCAPDFFIPMHAVSDVLSFYGELKKIFPQEAPGITRVARDAADYCRFMFALNELPTPMFLPWKATLKQVPGWLLKNTHVLRTLPRFVRGMQLPMDEYFVRHLRDPDLLRICNQMSYAGSPVSFGLAFITFLMDYYYPVGGVQTIPNALARCIEESGGRIRYRSRVEEILYEQGRVCGVRLKSGEEIRSTFVVSNGDARRTYLKMLPPRAVPEAYRSGLRQSEVSESFFTVFLGVNMAPEQIAEATHGCSHVVYLPDYKGVDVQEYGARGDRSVYARAPVELNCASLHDPSLAPGGKSVVTLQAPALAGFADNWGMKNGRRTRKYRALKEEVAAQVIATAENILPGLSRKIDLKLTATPWTFERYTLNAGGSSTGWSFHPRKGFHAGLKALSGFRPPVRNLYQVGHWSMSPGGAPSGIITGKIVSDLIGRRLRWGV